MSSSSNHQHRVWNADTASFCYLDLDFAHTRSRLGLCAAFVQATDSRYGWTSNDLRRLGGSEWKRIPESMELDHEWSGKIDSPVVVRPPNYGSRIVLRLDWKTAPLACENFATLCANGSNQAATKAAAAASNSNGGKKAKSASLTAAPLGESGKPLTYRSSRIHRIQPGFVLQGGDFVFGNGSGGESIYNGKKFKDERAGLLQKHDRRGILSMGNSGKHSNSSQFFITFQPAPQCDGKHVVFGKVVSGFPVLQHAETVGSQDGTPSVEVVITDCGVYTPLETPGAGYWYDTPDEDEESYSGVSPVFMVRPRVAIVAPTLKTAERFEKAMGEETIVVVTKVDVERNTEEGSDSGNGSGTVQETVQRLLSDFAIDVVVTAPAVRDVVRSIELPGSWNGIPRDQVLVEAKPVEALAAVRTRSWFTQSKLGWQLDGVHQ